MKDGPLVSIICTCYNQRSYIREALDSALSQTYPNIELVVIDDASTDGSPEAIESFIGQYPEVRFIKNPENKGLCKNFNQGLKLTTGKYVIDLSGDDVLIPNRVEKQISIFEKLDDRYGLVYSNAQVVDKRGGAKNHFYHIGEDGGAFEKPPSGDVYLPLIERCFIAAPTMMMRRLMLEELGGYDEKLDYEDFDLWIRSSRNWLYHYQDEVLTRIRKVQNSLSSKQYLESDGQLYSTYLVCRKIRELNHSEKENQALANRLKYELKHAVMSDKKKEAELFAQLLGEVQPLGSLQKFLTGLNRSGLKKAWLRNLILKIKA